MIKLSVALAVLLVLSSTAHAYADTSRQACTVPQPAGWAEAIVNSGIDTGGVSTTARAVTRDGEVLAVRDTGSTRDLLVIGADKAVRELYSVPEPNTFDIGYAGIDDRWIVLAIDRAPRNANGVLPETKRIEIMDRADGSIRTVAAQSPADGSVIPERNVLDSVVLHDGKVYWLTLDTYVSDTGTVRSFDPVTGATADIGSGVDELRFPDTTGAAWIVGLEQGGTGVGYRSPETGVVTVTGLNLGIDDDIPAVLVYGPFVVLDKGLPGTHDTLGIVVDTRTGAVTGLERRPGAQYDRVIDARGGVLAMNVWSGPDKGDTRVSVLGPDALTPLSC